MLLKASSEIKRPDNMLEPYRMVLINAISLLVIIAGILIYKFIYPKKTPNLFVLLILLTLLPLISLLRPGTYESGDLSYNVQNLMLFYDSITEGHLLPQWAGLSNATYGYPLFIFIYPLPYIIASFFHFFGFSFITSMKLFIAISYFFSGIFMFLWIKEEINSKSAFVASIFYLFAPYHLIDTHFRVSTGEIASFTIIPLVLFCGRKLILTKKLRWLILMTLSLVLLILSNQVIALIAFAFTFFYVLLTWYQKKNKKLYELFLSLLSFIFSLLLSAFYWIPVLFDAKFTHQADFIEKIGFVSISQLLYSPWRLGLLFQGPHGELSFLIGYVQIFILILSIFMLTIKKFNKYDKLKAIFFISSTLFFCFMMISQSEIIWNTVKILKNFQFTFRLLIFVALCLSFLAGLVIQKLNNKLIILLCLIVILQSILNWGNRKTIPEINDTTLYSEIPINTSTTAGLHPAVPRWVDIKHPWRTEIPTSHIEVLAGVAKIKELRRTSTTHNYIVYAESPITLKENTLYFPGWTTKLNGKEIPMIYDNKKYPGTITFKTPSGLYLLEVKFTETTTHKVAKTISITTFILFLFLILIKKKLRFIPKF